MTKLTKNKIAINAKGEYELTTIEGLTFICKRWFEKKSDSWHVVLPANTGTGRKYIRESLFQNGEIEFDNKTTPPRVLGSTKKNWRDYLLAAEKPELERLESEVEAIKTACEARIPKVVDESSVESLEDEIARLMAKMATIKTTPEAPEAK